MATPLLILYLYQLLVRSSHKGLKAMLNGSGDSVSPWYILHMIVIHTPQFQMNVTGTLLALYTPKNSCIHVWGNEL